MNTMINVTAQATQVLAAQIDKIDLKGEGLDGLNADAVSNMLVADLGAALIKTTLAGMANAPQYVRDAVEKAIKTSIRNLTKGVTEEAQGAANTSAAAKALVDVIVSTVTTEITDTVAAEIGDTSGIGNTALKVDSWLMALASILGKIADEKLENLITAGEELGGLGEGDDGFGTKSAQLTASSKIFAIVMEATTNVLKTTGDGITTAARK